MARSHLERLGSPAVVGAPESGCAGVAAVDASLLVGGTQRGVGLASVLGLRSGCVGLGARESSMVTRRSGPSSILLAVNSRTIFK